MRYVPGPGSPKDVNELWQYLQRELSRIQNVLENLEVIARTYHEPPKNPVVGQVVVADGTNWNPGSAGNGAGLYGWNGSSWVQIKILGGASVTVNTTNAAPVPSGQVTLMEVDSSGGPVTMTIDPGFQPGQELWVLDRSSNWSANNFTLDFTSSGYNYHGTTSNWTGATDGHLARFIYISPSTGFAGG